MVVSFDFHGHVGWEGQLGLDLDGFENGRRHGAGRVPDVPGTDLINHAVLNTAKDALAPVHFGQFRIHVGEHVAPAGDADRHAPVAGLPGVHSGFETTHARIHDHFAHSLPPPTTIVGAGWLSARRAGRGAEAGRSPRRYWCNSGNASVICGRCIARVNSCSNSGCADSSTYSTSRAIRSASSRFPRLSSAMRAPSPAALPTA